MKKKCVDVMLHFDSESDVATPFSSTSPPQLRSRVTQTKNVRHPKFQNIYLYLNIFIIF